MFSTIKYGEHNIDFFYLDEPHYSAPNRAAKNGKIWEKKLWLKYKNMIEKDDIVIDCGGFIGSHALPMAALGAKVICFEPVEKYRELLKKSADKNGFLIDIRPDLVGHVETAMKFYERNDGCSRMSGRKGIETIKNMITIDSLKLKSCKLMKIDVEGAEYETLEGAEETIKQFKPIIFIETFSNKRSKLEEWTISNNYKSTHMRGDDFILESL